MSRLYEITIELKNINPERIDNIKQWLCDEYGYDTDDWHRSGWAVTSHVYLCRGVTENEYLDLIGKDIWQLNGSYCDIEITFTCLEYVPTEQYSLDEDDYEKLMSGDNDE